MIIFRIKNKLISIIRESLSNIFINTISSQFSSEKDNNDNSRITTYNSKHNSYEIRKPYPYWCLFENIELRSLHKIKIAGEVVGRGIVMSEGKVELESTVGQKEYLDKLKSFHILYFRKFLPQSSLNNIIVLSNYLDRNYYHWMLESIGRLVCLSSTELQEYKFIIDYDAPQFAVDSLKYILNISQDQIIKKKELSRIKSTNILLPSYPLTKNESTKYCNIYHPLVIKRINSLAIQKSIIGSKKNIIIDRSKASQRRIVNKEKLLADLSEFDFEVIKLEDISFEEQLAVFAQANIIIATHGAGLVNLLFSNQPIVIELFPESRPIRDAFCFYQISSELKFQHHLIYYSPINTVQDLFVNSSIIKKIKTIIKNDLK